jgi:hypothetical protein
MRSVPPSVCRRRVLPRLRDGVVTGTHPCHSCVVWTYALQRGLSAHIADSGRPCAQRASVRYDRGRGRGGPCAGGSARPGMCPSATGGDDADQTPGQSVGSGHPSSKVYDRLVRVSRRTPAREHAPAGPHRQTPITLRPLTTAFPPDPGVRTLGHRRSLGCGQ